MSFIDITGTQINKSCLNHSPSKQMFSFSKAERFPHKVIRGCGSAAIYELPSIRNQRATTFGYGKKYDFTLGYKNKCNKFYDQKSDFDQAHPYAPRYSFGIGREKILKSKINDFPGPGSYNANKSFGADGIKVTMKGAGNRSLVIKKGKMPSPDQYKNIEMNPRGIYVLSKYRNTSSIQFGKQTKDENKKKKEDEKNNKEGKDKDADPTGPSPATYNKKHLMGSIFESKYRSYMPITMAGKCKLPKINENYPGPGSYNLFSEFGMYGIKKE